jgi:hypothetical protein
MFKPVLPQPIVEKIVKFSKDFPAETNDTEVTERGFS